MNWELCCLSHAVLQCELLSSEPLHFPISSQLYPAFSPLAPSTHPYFQTVGGETAGSRGGRATHQSACAVCAPNDEEECFSFLRLRPEG